MKKPEAPLVAPPGSSSTLRAPGRRAIMVAVGGAAAVAGLSLAWWRQAAPPKAAEPTGTPPPEGFWQTEWPTPQGTMLPMKSLAGKPMLLNFWATWCPPCIEELPLLNSFYKTHKDRGWQVLGLAVDKLQPVQTFLQKSPLDFPIGMAGLAGTELTRSLGNPAGGLPFSVVLSADGSILHRKMGRVTEEDLQLWAGLK
ncbi:MAG: TlpA family protein disulfide reductase [Candidatus Saccharibacteria bacterium]|nr:TlpA family protein disulfide reductase [Rhodoferax sp.]